MGTYKQQAADVEFFQSTIAFDGLRGFLGSAEALKMDHATLEWEVDVRGREVLRTLFQDHLSLRARLEEPCPVTGADGVRRTHVRDESRSLMLLFGPARVDRISLGARGHESLFPMDADLNLPREAHSFGVQQRVAIEAAKSSFDEAVESVRTQTGAIVSKRQAEQLTAAAAQDFEGFYAQRPSSQVRAVAGEIVVLTADAKGIVVRHEDLREPTRKAAEQTGHKLKKRLSKGEKRNRKRMAMVASVYSVAANVRTPQDIVKELRPVHDAVSPPRPKPRHKRVWASIVKDTDQVISEAFEEAAGRDPRREHKWAAVVDGNGPQLEAFEAEARRRRVDLTIVLDLIHALEYLWAAAYCFHADGTREAEAWVTERLVALLEGKASDVAAGIRRSATKRGLETQARRAADKCADYFLNHKQYMRYDDYLASGLPIASGVIEGACRHLVKDRMDITGARWSLGGAEAVLRVRALRSSGDFDDYWRFHLDRERHRNHLSRYADGIARPIAKPLLRLVT